MDLTEIRDRTAPLLACAGFAGTFDLCALSGGANNRVFRVQAQESRFLLKAYFRHPDDRRDRLGAEFSFLRFAWEHGIRSIPKALSCDAAAGLGLMEYLEGCPFGVGEVSDSAVQEALSFYRALNEHNNSRAAGLLPLVSEACFSLAEHVECVANRLRRLESVQPEAGVDAAAAAFIRNDLVPAWRDVDDSVRVSGRSARLSLDEPLARDSWRLSPSDFGFHNALRTGDGCTRFFDFEYAGWDDPARMVCDFFCQPAVPVPLDYFEGFAEGVSADSPDPETTRARIHLLLPVYRIKWCCILLNDFLPVGGRRRSFATGEATVEERKHRQLEKARHLATEDTELTEKYGILERRRKHRVFPDSLKTGPKFSSLWAR
jgi:Phosphotransferase enzyme family